MKCSPNFCLACTQTTQNTVTFATFSQLLLHSTLHSPLSHLHHGFVSYKSQNALSTHCESCKKLLPQTPHRRRVAVATLENFCDSLTASLIEQIKRYKKKPNHRRQPAELGFEMLLPLLIAARRTHTLRRQRRTQKVAATNEFRLFCCFLAFR